MKISNYKSALLAPMENGRITPSAGVALALFLTVALGFYLLWIGAAAGTFIVGDEGYILATAARPDLVHRAAPYNFGEIMHSVWVFSGQSVVGYRRFTLVSGSLLAGVLACALLRHTGAAPSLETYCITFLLGAFAWLSAHLSGFLSTGYNQIASIAVAVAAYGITLLFVPLSKNKARVVPALFGGLVVGVASVLMMYSKYSALVYIPIAIVVFLALSFLYKNKEKPATPAWLVGLGSLLILLTILEIHIYLDGTWFVQEYIAALGLHKRVINRDILNLVACFMVFLLGAVAWKQHQRPHAGILAEWLPLLMVLLVGAIFWSSLVLQTWHTVRQAATPTSVIYAVSPLFAMLLAISVFYVLGQQGGALVWGRDKSTGADISLFLVCTALIGAVVLMPVGTSSTYGFQLNLFNSMLGWLIVVAGFLIHDGRHCSRPARAMLVALCVIGVLLAMAQGYARLNAMIGTPVKPRSAADWIPVPFPDQGSVYLLPQVATGMIAMKEAVRAAHWQPGTYILDLTGIAKGVLFYLGGRPIAHGWYSSVAPGRDALGATALALRAIEPDALRDAWVAKWETAVDGELPAGFLNDFQLAFPARYALVGAFRILPGYPKLQIWAPLSADTIQAVDGEP